VNERQFEIGNIVQLKSSPQTMTVREYATNTPQMLLCCWISDKGEPQEQWYFEGMLAFVGE